MQSRIAAPLMIALVAGILACDTAVDKPSSDASTIDAPPSVSCMEAEDHSDLEWIQTEIFDKSCNAFSSCHRGRALSAGGLNLEEGNVIESLVDQPSDLFDDWILLAPGDPDNSYLMVLLGNTEGPIDPEVGTMPQNSPLLCREKRDAIERWIVALGDTVDGGPPGADAGTDAAAATAVQAGHLGPGAERLRGLEARFQAAAAGRDPSW